MKAIRFGFGSLLFAAFFASTSMAQAQRTFVSGPGNDGNPCSRMAPCRTLGTAIAQTNAGGEVIVLDSAGYGAFAIGKAVSVIAPPGVYAGISVFSGDGIDINAGASDAVILRGLTVNNQGSTGSGIVFNTGGTLHIENCVFNGFSNGLGVSFNGAGKLEINESIIRNNSEGILMLPSRGTATGVLDHVRLEGNSNTALRVGDGSKVNVRNSVASGNDFCFYAISQTSADAELNIENCVVSNNRIGVAAFSGGSTGVATVRVSNSTVTDNVTGLDIFGTTAVILSRGNNTVEGNQFNTTGTVGSYTAK